MNQPTWVYVLDPSISWARYTLGPKRSGAGMRLVAFGQFSRNLVTHLLTAGTAALWMFDYALLKVPILGLWKLLAILSTLSVLIKLFSLISFGSSSIFGTMFTIFKCYNISMILFKLF